LEAVEVARNAREEAEKEALAVKEVAAEQGRLEGFEQGRQEGFGQGQVEGKNSYADLTKNLTSVLTSLSEERKKIIADFQPLLIELVGESLKRCLKKESENSSMVIEFVKEVLRKAQDRVDLKLHLNPADVGEIETQKKQLQLSVGAGELEIIPDARIERGGCLLETEAGSVDARIATIVDQVKETLNFELKK
jgi:flagellar assembly protein FliH